MDKLTPTAQYEDIYFDDGTHTGLRIDRARWLIEVQRRKVKKVIDLTVYLQVLEKADKVCYTEQQ